MMKDVFFLTIVLSLYLLASGLDLDDAEREEQALAQHWIEIREAQQ